MTTAAVADPSPSFSERRFEKAEPRFKIHQKVHMFLQQPVFMQITEMDQSAWIYITTNANGGTSGVGGGSAPTQQQQQSQQQQPTPVVESLFGELAMGMPLRQFPASGRSSGQQKSTSTTLLQSSQVGTSSSSGGGLMTEETASHWARRLAARYQKQFLLNVDLSLPSAVQGGGGIGGGFAMHGSNEMLLAFSEKKLTEMLKGIYEPATTTVVENTASVSSS